MKDKLAQIAKTNERLFKVFDWLWDTFQVSNGKSIELENHLNEMESCLLKIDSIVEPYVPNENIDKALAELDFQTNAMFKAINRMNEEYKQKHLNQNTWKLQK